MKLEGNTVLITGGSSGIGLALAERFLAAGNEVIVCGRRESALADVRAKHPAIQTVVADTGSAASREGLARDLIAKFPKLNVLVNNAGIQKRVNVRESGAWSDTAEEIAINLEGPIHLSMLFMSHLLKVSTPERRSVIANVSSGLAFAPIAAMPLYCATKAALHSFTLSLRHQVRETLLEVIEIIPPAVRTNLGGAHDFGEPLADYADSVIAQLREGRAETTYTFSAKSSQASRTELDEMFTMLNTKFA
jgi:uncharacterized oxidoreductase